MALIEIESYIKSLTPIEPTVIYPIEPTFNQDNNFVDC